MALDRLMPSINASRPGMDHTSPSDRSIPYIHAAFRRLTLAVHPSDQGMFALAVGEGAADWLSSAARGPTAAFTIDCSAGPPDQFLNLTATASTGPHGCNRSCSGRSFARLDRVQP